MMSCCDCLYALPDWDERVCACQRSPNNGNAVSEFEICDYFERWQHGEHSESGKTPGAEGKAEGE